MKCGSHWGEVWWFLSKFKVQLTHDQAMSLPGICPREMKHKNLSTKIHRALSMTAKDSGRIPHVCQLMAGHTKCGIRAWDRRVGNDRLMDTRFAVGPGKWPATRWWWLLHSIVNVLKVTNEPFDIMCSLLQWKRKCKVRVLLSLNAFSPLAMKFCRKSSKENTNL